MYVGPAPAAAKSSLGTQNGTFIIQWKDRVLPTQICAISYGDKSSQNIAATQALAVTLGIIHRNYLPQWETLYRSFELVHGAPDSIIEGDMRQALLTGLMDRATVIISSIDSLGRHTGIPRSDRKCRFCSSAALGDENHAFKCPGFLDLQVFCDINVSSQPQFITLMTAFRSQPNATSHF